MLPKTADVVIIGGGVMGASAAYHLAKRGCTDIVLLEKGPFLGMEATGKCAGGIRYQFSTEINVQLSLLSLPMLQRFEEEFGQDIDLRWPGYLFLLDNEADLATFRRNVAMQNRLGMPWVCVLPTTRAKRWRRCLSWTTSSARPGTPAMAWLIPMASCRATLPEPVAWAPKCLLASKRPASRSRVDESTAVETGAGAIPTRAK